MFNFKVYFQELDTFHVSCLKAQYILIFFHLTILGLLCENGWFLGDD